MDTVFLTTMITTIGGAAAFYLGRGQRRTANEKTAEEVESLRIQNLKNTITIYETVHTELTEQLKLVKDECVKLREEISTLRQENISLKKELHELNKRFQNSN